MAASILVVDDDPIVCELLAELLGGIGYQVTSASDGYSAVPIFQRLHPDLLILDYRMPAGSGVEVLKKVRALDIGRRTPAIFLSATAQVLIRLEAGEDPLVRYLEKPLDSVRLAATVLELLGPKGIRAAERAERPAPAAGARGLPRQLEDGEEPGHSGTVLDLD